MTELQKFLMDNPVDGITKEVIISERLRDMPFTIKCITSQELDDYQKRCIKNIGSKKKVQMDTVTFNELVILNHCVTPNFKDAEWVKQSGCMRPNELLYKVLTSGEIMSLSEQIQKLSGFGEVEQEEMQEEIKNF